MCDVNNWIQRSHLDLNMLSCVEVLPKKIQLLTGIQKTRAEFSSSVMSQEVLL